MAQTLIRRLSASGAVPTAVGLGCQAATTYLTLILAGRELGSARFVGVSALFVLINSVATGLFLPLEQEVARRKGHERVGAVSEPGLIPRALRLGLITSAVAIGASLALHSVMLQLLNGNEQLFWAFCLALPGYACCFVTRGLFAGSRETLRYGVQLGVEGTFRLIGMGVLILLAGPSVANVGWLFGCAPWVGLLASLVARQRPLTVSIAAPPEPEALLKSFFLLVLSSFAAQLLINAGPVVVQLLASPAERATAGTFLAVLVIVRLPVLLFTAVQPIFLPSLSGHIAAGRREDFTALMRRILQICAVFSVLSALALTFIGPIAVRVLFGFHDQIPRPLYLVTGVSVGLFLASSIMSQALLATGSHLATTVGWLIGAAGLGAGTAIGTTAVDRASAGFLVGAVAATASFGWMLLRSPHVRVNREVGSVGTAS